MIYRIKDWERHYEVADSKKVSGPLSWVAVRTKTDGFGYARITSERDRSELLAAWYLMLGIAAKQPRADRGKLQRDGIGLTAEDMALMTRFPAQIFERALVFFSDPRQGWLEVDESSGSVRMNPDESGSVRNVPPTGQDRTGQDRTVGHVAQRRAAGAAPASDSEWLAELGRNPAYQGINVGAEYGKAQAWCGANRKQLTRRRFINWLNRAEKPLPRQITIPSTPRTTEPRDWRTKVKALYPDASDDLTWATLPDSIKEVITSEDGK